MWCVTLVPHALPCDWSHLHPGNQPCCRVVWSCVITKKIVDELAPPTLQTIWHEHASDCTRLKNSGSYSSYKDSYNSKHVNTRYKPTIHGFHNNECKHMFAVQQAYMHRILHAWFYVMHGSQVKLFILKAK